MPTTEIYKKCSCGREYTQEEWNKLFYVGIMPGSANGKRLTDDLEMRNCPICESTISIVIEGGDDGESRN